MEFSVDRIIRAARLEDGEFDAVDHPFLNVWLQSKNAHSRVSIGYTGKLPVKLRSCRGYRVIHDFKQERAMNYIVFEENESGLRRSFASVIVAAWEQSLQRSTPQSSLEALLVAVRDLKQLFGRNQSDFSPEELRGLMAELLTVRFLAELGSPLSRILEAWRAPAGSVRDFVFSATHSLEVKSARPDSGTITISSVAQLDQEEPGLQLIVWPLVQVEAETPGALTLNELVADLRAECSRDERALQLYDDAMVVLGLDKAEESLSEVAFSYNDCFSYDVTADFPRIRATGISEQIRDVTYTLRTADLSKYVAELSVP